jgi:PAS domain S-box-containing protein
LADALDSELAKVAGLSDLAAGLLPVAGADAVASAVLTALPFPVAVVDQRGIIVRVNEAWNRLAEEAGGQPVRRAHVGDAYNEVCQRLAVHLVDAAACGDAVHAVLDRVRSVGHARFSLRSREGIRHFAIQVIATTIPLGGAVVIHTEDTAPVLRTVVSEEPSNAEGVWLLDAAGRTTFVNAMTADLLAYEPGEMLGQAAYLFLDHASIAAFHAALQRLRQGTSEGIELKLRRRDATTRWVLARVSPLAHPDGTHAGASVTLVDATASHGTEERIRSALDALQAVVAASPLAITTCDIHGRIDRWSAAAARLFGWSEAEAFGQVIPIVPADQQEEDRRYREEALSGKLVTGRETTRLNRDGVPVPVSMSLSPLHERDGRAGGLVVVYDDIAPRKRAEADVVRGSRFEATAKLAGGVAHDVNNLMAGILGNAELLREELTAGDEARPVLDDIAEAAMRAGALAQQLLAYARGGRYRPEPVNLNAVITTVIDEQHGDWARPAAIEVHSEPSLWPVDADRSQMSQLWGHLLANAVEATASGGRITVATSNVELTDEWAAARPGARAGAHVLLSIVDEGVGMDAHTLEHAFEPFFTTRANARGLGLAAAFGIVKSHGGYLHVESQPGHGTRFDVYLPAAAIASPALPASPVVTPFVMPRGTERLLVVDDEPALRDVMRKLLERLGYLVDVAVGGADGITKVEANPARYGLVVLDMRMPAVNGPTAFRRMRAAAPGLRILIATGFERDEEAQALLDEGAVGFLQKPFEQARLAAEVRKALDA